VTVSCHQRGKLSTITTFTNFLVGIQTDTQKMSAYQGKNPTQEEAEDTLWDVYNKVADNRDEELIKDWRDSLNFLLVFVGYITGS
jgi:Family of unknown function (DUF6535)